MKSTNSNSDGHPPYIERFLNLSRLLGKKSHFLLGPRQTGKTFLIHHTLKNVRLYDLLDTSVYLALSQNPGRMAVATLQGREFRSGTREFDEAFETYLMHELVSYTDYVSGEPLSYWRSTSGFEVDFIIGDHTGVEAKAKENVSAQDVRSLRALAEERKLKRYLCVSLEPRMRKFDCVTVLPLRAFLGALWNGEYV